MKRENRITERGFSQWIILIILMVGIGVGVWVAQIRTNLVPQAAPGQETSAQLTSMSLKLEKDSPPIKGEPFLIQIILRSEIDSVRLVSSQIKYDPNYLELIKIETPPTASVAADLIATDPARPRKPQVSHWLETLFNNQEGKASLTGLFNLADLKTNQQENMPFLYTSLLLRAKVSGETEISFDDTSLMLRAADNTNILTKKDNLKLIIVEASASAVPAN
jgi:hypothetical protein